MKHIKTFESFNINETMDMMTMPVDPIAGAADVYSDIADAIGNKIGEITNALKKAAAPEVAKIKAFMLKTFGTTTPEFNEENAEKLYKVLGLASIKEGYQEGENLAVKLCGLIKQILGINMYAWAGIPLAVVIGGLMGSGVAVGAVLIGSWSLLWIFTKLMNLFGYGNTEDADVADIGDYDPSHDARMEFKRTA
jgi:hypothetical protein